QGYEAGADDYVTKPFDEEELLAKVRVHLRMKSIEEVDELKTTFLGLLQHETRTPLTGILGAADLLLDDGHVDTAERKELAGMIHSSAARLHDLLAKVVTLAELKSGTRDFEPTSVDLPMVVRDAVAEIGGEAAGNGVTVHCGRLDAAPVLVDRAWMTTAIRALLDNAIRFSPRDTSVIVEVSGVPSGGSYTAVGTYDHGELIALVAALSRATGLAIPVLVREFGRHLFRRFVELYPRFFSGVGSAFDFLMGIEMHIHTEVKKLDPDAELPSFECSAPAP